MSALRPHTPTTPTRRLLRAFAVVTGAAAAVLPLAPMMAAPADSAALVPPPCGTPGTPQCPTTTTRPPVVMPRPTTTTLPAQMSTTSTSPAPPPTTAPPTPVPTEPPPAITAPPETAAQQLPTTTVAMQQVAAPLVVDPDDPTGTPPLIVGTATECVDIVVGSGAVSVTFLNVDLFHYPPGGPFSAEYDWEFVAPDGSTETGTTITWTNGYVFTVETKTLVNGVHTFTVTDRYLDLSATVEIQLDWCGAGPAASPDPLPPEIQVPVVTCDSDTTSGKLWVLVRNPAGDDGSDRGYEYTVAAGAVIIKDHLALDVVVEDGTWSGQWVAGLSAGAHTVTVTDIADAALEASLDVDVPACPADPPVPGADPPLLPPSVLVDPSCAAAPATTAPATLLLYNHHFDAFGGDVSTKYTVTIIDAVDAEVDSFTADMEGGIHPIQTPALPIGTYEVTIGHSMFPAMADSASFEIEACAVQPIPHDPTPLELYDVATFCIPGDEVESVAFFVRNINLGQLTYGWWLLDEGLTVVAEGGWHYISTQPHFLVARPDHSGTFGLLVEEQNNPANHTGESVTVEECASVVPTDPTDPTEPTEPTATTTASPGGTLPATGAPIAGVVVVAIALAGVGFIAVAATKRRSTGEDLNVDESVS